MNTSCSSCTSNKNENNILNYITYSTDATIKEIQISGSQLVINYSGGSKPPPPPPPPSGSWRGDIVGYIGSGGCVSTTDIINQKTNIPDYYNIVKISFWIGGHIGQVDSGYDKIPEWLSDWRKGTDPWGRDRKLILSIGGQHGSGLTEKTGPPIVKNIVEQCNNNLADGIDIDLESPGGTSIPVLQSLRDVLDNLNPGKIITLVPEATHDYYSPTDGGYREWLTSKKFSWVSPQFYNNDANGSGLPGMVDKWPAIHFAQDIEYVMDYLHALKKEYSLSDSQIGLLTPCTTCGANDGDDNSDKIIWNMTQLARYIMANNIQHVGSWDLTYDEYVGNGQKNLSYPWAGTLAQLLLGKPDTTCSYCPFDENVTGIVRALSAPGGATDVSCSRICAIDIGDRVMEPLPKAAPYESGGVDPCKGRWKGRDASVPDSHCNTNCFYNGIPDNECFVKGKPAKKSDGKPCYCPST